MSKPKDGTRPWVPCGSFSSKQQAEATAYALSGVGANGKAMVFEATTVRKKKKGKIRHAMIRVH